MTAYKLLIVMVFYLSLRLKNSAQTLNLPQFLVAGNVKKNSSIFAYFAPCRIQLMWRLAAMRSNVELSVGLIAVAFAIRTSSEQVTYSLLCDLAIMCPALRSLFYDLAKLPKEDPLPI
jgi:hypothetical protein